TQICLGESMKLTASGADTYTWAGNGAGTLISVSPASSAVYTLTGFSNAGCSAVTTKSVTVNQCLGIKETSQKDNFIVYPNPSTGAFTIAVDHDLTLYVYSFSGQVLQVVDLDRKNDRTCRLDGFPKGIYFITDDKGKHVQKLVVH
ncbi:MAG TPA: T9SS type A sorting domain-containing protein, partial [Puia sp.]|nr:T9SS type A sorting domain-containing protein [Puia sp.]